MFLHSVGDPHRFEQIATSILGNTNARSEIARSVTDQLTNINLLTPEQQTAVRGAVADALADPRIVDNFVAAFGSAQSSALGIPDPRPSAIDVGALVAVLREHLAATQPALAASIPISTQTVELPKIKSNALADLRKAANTWTVWLALLSVTSLVVLMIFGDRRVVLRSYGFWAILTGAFWAIGPRLAPWIAHRSAPQADGLVKATIDAVAGPITTAATILLISGVISVKLALKYPDMFSAAVSHSGAVGFARRDFEADGDWGREWTPVFGPSPAGGPDDPFALAETIDRAHLPALRIDCGVDDFLIEENRAFDAHLTSLNIPHEYEEHPGGHSWEYWDAHVQETIAFFKRVLPLGEEDPAAGQPE